MTVGGGAGIALQLYTGGIAVVKSAVDATSITTGSLLTKGGVGVAKRIYAGSVIVALGTTAATSATTGTLISTGGVGIAKQLYTGGVTVIKATTAATSSITGSLLAKGGCGIALNLYSGSAIVALGTTVSSSEVTGSLLTKGGLGVAGKAYIGEMIVIKGTTAATTSISGAVITAGGIGAAKSLYTAGQIVASIDNSVANAVTDALVLKHSTSGTAANGIGVGISIGIEDAGGLAEAASLDFTLTSVTSTSEFSNFDVKLMAAGSMTSSLTVTGSKMTLNGGLKMSSGSVTQSNSLQTSVTLNKHSGIITTVSASTAANGCEGFPFSNNKIAASDVIQVAIMTYSGTFGTNGIPTVAVSAIGGGSCTVQVCNAGTGGLSGTLKISFWVLKQS